MVETTGGEPGDGAAEVLDRPLPDGVRRRVVQIVSDGFGGLTVAELPAQLRQYARFTPNRRAKFAGNAMAAALETDTLFRQRIGGEAQGGPAGAGRGPGRRFAAPGRRSAGRGRRGLRAAPHGLGEARHRGRRGGAARRRRAGRRGEPGRAGAAARGAGRRPRPHPDRDRAAAYGAGVGEEGSRIAAPQAACRPQRRQARRGGPAQGARRDWRPCAPRGTRRSPRPRARRGGSRRG